MGLPKDWQAQQEPKAAQVEDDHGNQANGPVEGQDGDEEVQPPPGFPHEDEFESMICYKCVESNPWIKQYAGTPGFLPAVGEPVCTHQPPEGAHRRHRRQARGLCRLAGYLLRYCTSRSTDPNHDSAQTFLVLLHRVTPIDHFPLIFCPRM